MASKAKTDDPPPTKTDPAETAMHVDWARDLYDAVEPHSSGLHLLNFQSEASDDVVRAAFGKNYARLSEVKRAYDPRNVFRSNQNIAPSERSVRLTDAGHVEVGYA